VSPPGGPDTGVSVGNSTGVDVTSGSSVVTEIGVSVAVDSTGVSLDTAVSVGTGVSLGVSVSSGVTVWVGVAVPVGTRVAVVPGGSVGEGVGDGTLTSGVGVARLNTAGKKLLPHTASAQSANPTTTMSPSSAPISPLRPPAAVAGGKVVVRARGGCPAAPVTRLVVCGPGTATFAPAPAFVVCALTGGTGVEGFGAIGICWLISA
jgi:hypothetical protein